jgi:hypothetical protein
MRAWIANTDFEWYRFLSGRPDLDELNFWRPSGAAFKVLAPGEPLLFRLKAPYHAIAGLGFFVQPADYKIGCIILAEPVFFSQSDWIPQPRDWRPQTEVGRREDLAQGEGLRIWQAILERLHGRRTAEPLPEAARY